LEQSFQRRRREERDAGEPDLQPRPSEQAGQWQPGAEHDGWFVWPAAAVCPKEAELDRCDDEQPDGRQDGHQGEP
jgi:hypothetical protein